MEDADGRRPIHRSVREGEAKRVGLVHDLKVAAFGDHPGGHVTTDGSGEMRLRGVSLGLATLCVGGGQGAAMVLERAA